VFVIKVIMEINVKVVVQKANGEVIVTKTVGVLKQHLVMKQLEEYVIVIEAIQDLHAMNL